MVGAVWVQFLGWEDTLEKGKATHSSILAWKIPWGCKESDMTERLSLSSIEFYTLFLKIVSIFLVSMWVCSLVEGTLQTWLKLEILRFEY